MKFKYLFIVVIALLSFSNLSIAQKRKDVIKLVSTGQGGALEVVKRTSKVNVRGKEKEKNESWQKISGSNVIFQQGNTMYYCKEAYFNKKKNQLEAIGNVRIVSDSMNVTGDNLFYDGKTKIAQLRGNVVLIDKTMTLKTPNLDYNMANYTGNYFGGGRITDAGNVLTSKNGFYNKTEQYLIYTNDVKLVSADATLFSEELHYSLNTKVAQTKGPTTIIGNKGEKTESLDFTYDTKTKKAEFVELKGTTEEYELRGKETFTDDIKKFSRAKINVSLVIKKDSITIFGDFGTHDKLKGIAKVWGNVLVLSKMGADTMFLTADSLIALSFKEDSSKDKLLAYNNVKIFKADLQGKCDSMVYNTGDSTIFLYDDPILWTDGSQIKADSINMQLVNKKIDKLNMRMNAFLISEDSVHNFNQLKGKHMKAHFKNNSIKRVDVDGNGESIYFVLDKGDSILMGMNKVICSNMIIKFGEKNKMERVSFITTPDGSFVPPHEIEEPEKRLKGFRWRIKERPEREELMSVRKNKQARLETTKRLPDPR